MGVLEDIEKYVLEGEKAVKEAEIGLRILKEAEEDVTEQEAELILSKERLIKLKKAILKEKTKKE